MSAEPTVTDPVVQACELTVGYDREPVLTGVDLVVPRGRITALIGANGCGKSTLLKTVSRVLPSAAGSVLLDGREIAGFPRRDLARRLASLPQSPIAPEGLTVRELVRFGRHPHRGFGGRLRSEDDDAVAAAMRDAGMEDLADRPVDSLSGGQRQRAWIAMALAQQTPVLLLDEPTTYLDIAHQTEVLGLLRRLNREQGRTIVMVLHDLNQAARYAHHVIAVGEDRVMAAGAPAEVIVTETVERVFGLACTVVPHPVDGSPLCLPLD